MSFFYEKIKTIIGKILWIFIWFANIILNIVAYIKEQHWVSIVMIVICSIWFIITIADIIITFRDLKKFCDKYDEQVKKLCEDTHITITEEH